MIDPNVSDILRPREWARGIPLGWTVTPDPSSNNAVTGQVLYQDHLIALDRLAYALWSDALQGRVDFAQCGQPDYMPPCGVVEHQHTGHHVAPHQIAEAATSLREAGLLWRFDLNDAATSDEAQRFEVAVQGIPLGNIEQPDRYRIAHSHGAPALEVEGTAYMIFLQWWTDPTIYGAASAVAQELGIPLQTAMAHAIRTLLAGLRVGILFIAGSSREPLPW